MGNAQRLWIAPAPLRSCIAVVLLRSGDALLVAQSGKSQWRTRQAVIVKSKGSMSAKKISSSASPACSPTEKEDIDGRNPCSIGSVERKSGGGEGGGGRRQDESNCTKIHTYFDYLLQGDLSRHPSHGSLPLQQPMHCAPGATYKAPKRTPCVAPILKQASP